MMRNYLLLIVILLVVLKSSANAPSNTFEHLKYSKVILGTTNNEKLNRELKDIAYRIWDICPVETSMPLKEALKLAKSNDSLFVIYPASLASKAFANALNEIPDYTYKTPQEYIAFSDGKKKPLLRSFLPLANNTIHKESIIHSINYIQYILKTMVDDNYKSLEDTVCELNKKGGLISNKAIYVHNLFLNKNLKQLDVANHYSNSSKVIAYNNWETQAFTKANKNPVMVVPVYYKGEYIFQHYIMDSKKEEAYVFLQPKKEAIPDYEDVILSKKEKNKKHKPRPINAVLTAAN